MTMVNSVAFSSADLQSESRISWLTMLLGALAALPVAYFYGWRWGIGIFIGAGTRMVQFSLAQTGRSTRSPKHPPRKPTRKKPLFPWPPISKRCSATG